MAPSLPSHQSSSSRVLIRVVVNAIPDVVERRPTTLWERYCATKLGRISGLSDGVDVVHVPGGFDLQEPVKRWFLYDVGVTETLSAEQVMALPHYAYRAVLNAEGHLTFVDLKIGDKIFTSLANSYSWTLQNPDSSH